MPVKYIKKCVISINESLCTRSIWDLEPHGKKDTIKRSNVHYTLTNITFVLSTEVKITISIVLLGILFYKTNRRYLGLGAYETMNECVWKRGYLYGMELNNQAALHHLPPI